MKKIDLHIHTIATGKDAGFDFDLEKLKQYVLDQSIDVIAITNHNLFELDQFNTISNSLNIIVLPGIEIDFENGHLLLIGEINSSEDFANKCSAISREVADNSEITVSKLQEIFIDLNNYLLIPHYEKKPKINYSAIEALDNCVIAGEVQSPKKFNRVIKDANSPTPVLFSDLRISASLDIEQTHGKQTYIKTDADLLSLAALKSLLSDKNKIFITNKESHDFFQILNNGQQLSNGLNVILGGRSSGKTFFLDKLSKIYDIGDKSIKYIKQFDLIKNDDKKFNEIVEKEKSSVREKYLQEFKTVVDCVVDIDRYATNFNIDKYIKSLVEFATSEKLHDDFSNAVLFTETPFQLRSNENLIRLIKAVKLLKEDNIYNNTINKHITSEQLNGLYGDLEKQFKVERTEQVKKQWINELVLDIRQKLEHNTASPKVEDSDINFFNIKMEREKLRRFEAIAKAIRKEIIINEDLVFEKFKIRAVGTKYNCAQELHDECGKQISFAPAYSKYDSPLSFLQELKKLERLERSELYKYFCKVSYYVLNKFDKKISGGERAEFNLLKVLQDARQYEMLLIDEPESSFDNLFLKDNVNKEIKELSKELPVIVVTHNSTVGMLMHPDYILYTQREIIDDKDNYFLYSGSSGDKEFLTADGQHQINSYDTLLNALEAGEDAYDARKLIYNSFKK